MVPVASGIQVAGTHDMTMTVGRGSTRWSHSPGQSD